MNRARSSEDTILSDAPLTRLAGELGNEWRSLGVFLGLSKAQLDQCFINHPGDIKAAMVDMLVIWQRETSGSGQAVAQLVQALKEIGRVDLAEKVEDGDFIELPDQVAGNRENPDQVAGNRLETSGHHNVIIQAGNNANINVNVPAPITESQASSSDTNTVDGADFFMDEGHSGAANEGGYDQNPSSPSSAHQRRPPNPAPPASSRDSTSRTNQLLLDECVCKLLEMEISADASKQVVLELIDSGQRDADSIVDKALERILRENGTSRPTFDDVDGQHSSEEDNQADEEEARRRRAEDGSGQDVVSRRGEEGSTSLVNVEGQSGSNIQNIEAELPRSDDDEEDVTVSSIPSLEQQPLTPQPTALRQQDAVNKEESSPTGHHLNPTERDEIRDGQEESADSTENQPPEVLSSTSGEERPQLDTMEANTTSNAETEPKGPVDSTDPNQGAEQAAADVDHQSALVVQEVSNITDGNQPVYDKKRGLYILTSAHIKQMTDDFSESKKIGHGSFGSVFQSVYPYNGPLKGINVAVKVNSPEDQGHREFMQELKMAESKHPHLLPLFGICEDETCLSLVSPYMVNKDLKSWIQDKKEPTDWKTRLVIGLDLVSAIRYYHKKTEGPNKKFHCDVKSANVLLDAQHRSRLGDPGLMREVSRDKTHLTRTGSLSADWGTPYYQDPYYLKYRKHHETSDLYSAGKVLLELLTSITADKEENRRLLFEIWFEDLDYFDKESDGTKLCEVADRSPVVAWPECSEGGSSVTQQFAKLIIGCLQERPKNRIKLEDLHQKLKVLVQRSAAIGKHNKVVPDCCMFCLSCKPCPVPMACGCALLCSTCMKSHTEALYCPNHLMETTGLGHNTFAIIVGQRGFEEDAVGFKDAITDPQICGVREENVKLLKKATIEDVGKAVAEVAGRIQQVQKGQETFFIYYHSGHGKQRGLDFNHTTVLSRKLRTIFKESKATKSLYILDSCRASSVEVYTSKGPGGPEESSSTSEETENTEQEDQEPQEPNVFFLPEGSMLWASSRKYEDSWKKANNKFSPFTKYIVKGLQGGNCGTDNCSDCLSFQHQAKAIGAVNLNLLRDYVYDHVKRELQNFQIPSLQGQQERTYWMAYAQD
ncbi:IRAK2 [Branchiostoma lanceolatum]|uniref:IRAK2 protein n=1 Tax=Branchiostoma lanceolatum TaxID=7740 RepID=A0A8K0EX24_BRALA|nr:IRAK2 [Branchiostoma lanceolatum]